MDLNNLYFPQILDSLRRYNTSKTYLLLLLYNIKHINPLTSKYLTMTLFGNHFNTSKPPPIPPPLPPPRPQQPQSHFSTYNSSYISSYNSSCNIRNSPPPLGGGGRGGGGNGVRKSSDACRHSNRGRSSTGVNNVTLNLFSQVTSAHSPSAKSAVPPLKRKRGKKKKKGSRRNIRPIPGEAERGAKRRASNAVFSARNLSSSCFSARRTSSRN